MTIKNIYTYYQKDDNINANSVNATVGYHDPHNGQKYILMMS